MQSEDALHSRTTAKILPGKTNVLNRASQKKQQEPGLDMMPIDIQMKCPAKREKMP